MKTLVKFVLGVVVGTILWTMGAPTYNHLLATVTEPLLNIDSGLRNAELQPSGRSIRVSSPAPDPLPPTTIPADQLTYNVILLTGLFAANRHPLRDRNLRAFALAAVCVVIVHPLALVATVESTYAARLGAWSEEHYGSLVANVWLTAELFYRVVGMFGLVFVLWWLERTASGTKEASRQQKQRRST